MMQNDRNPNNPMNDLPAISIAFGFVFDSYHIRTNKEQLTTAFFAPDQGNQTTGLNTAESHTNTTEYPPLHICIPTITWRSQEQ